MKEKEEFNQDLLNYITETTSNVRNLIDKLEKKEDINKLKFLILNRLDCII